jgi:rubrerythrin
VSERDACLTCREGDIIRDGLRAIGNIEAHVTTEPPLVKNQWTESWTCPGCGRTWYSEPTPEQRMRWAKDQTP